jgi:hypothetical protein
MTIPTTEKLAKALVEAKAPLWMINKAREGHYDDFKSLIATPIVALVNDLRNAGLKDMAKLAMDGEWDSTDEEAEEWTQSPDGQEAIRRLINNEQSANPSQPPDAIDLK